MVRLKIDKYLMENDNKITNEILFDVLDKKQRILLVSAMNTGKTTFIMEYLSKILRVSDIQLIFVTPIKSLINNIKSKYPKAIKCNGDIKELELKDNAPVVTTPDSMYKVINLCEKENKNYFIVFDEIHQVVVNADFRESLKNPFIFYEKELCIGLLGITATEDPLENVNFDKRFKVDVKEKFIPSNEIKIIKDFTKNIDNMLSFIKYIKKLYPNKLIVARVNNKEDIKILKDKLNNCVGWYRSKDDTNKYLKDMELLEEVLTGQDLKEIDYLLCTSLIDVGIEINLKEKPIVIDFLDNNSTLVDDIQFMGRFRQGIEVFYLVGKLNKINPNTKRINQKEEYNLRATELGAFIESANKIKENIIGDLNVIGVKTVLDENKEKTFIFDKYSLMQKVFKKYINFYLQTDVYLKLFLKQHPEVFNNNISINSYNELNIIESKELKAEQDKLKNNIEEYEREFFNKIKTLNLDDETLKSLLNNQMVEVKDISDIKIYEEICNSWQHEKLEEYRKRYIEVSELLKDSLKNTKEKEVLKIALTKKSTNSLKKQINYIKYNLLFNENKELNLKYEKDMKIVYLIRAYITKDKGKEILVCLGNKFKLELLNYLQKEKSLSKLTANKLDKQLNLIYNISRNKLNKDIISSVKLKI